MKIVASLIGARQHYEPISMACKAGCLSRLITDFWVPYELGSNPLLKRYIRGDAARFLGRTSSSIPRRQVRPIWDFGIRYSIAQRRASNRKETFGIYESMGEEFARRANRHLDVDHDVFFGFTSAALESMEYEKRIGRIAVLDVVDPGRAEYRLVCEEEKKHPRFVQDHSPVPDSYYRRVECEWNTADRLVVNSEWTRRLLIEQGVPDSKIWVVPLPYRNTLAVPRRQLVSGPLRVLWLGTLCLRKGLPYALAAARQLRGAAVRFTFVGPLQVPKEALDLPDNCSYVGAVPRSSAGSLYADHDVFILPTMSDGFAITQIEALAHGLPVIATERCGEVVQDGRSGILIPAGDASSLEGAISLFFQRDFLSACSAAASQRSQAFAPDVIWGHYRNAFERYPSTAQ